MSIIISEVRLMVLLSAVLLASPACLVAVEELTDQDVQIERLSSAVSTAFREGRFLEAERQAIVLVEKQQVMLGSRDPITIRSKANLAELHRAMGHYVDAERIYEDLLGSAVPVRSTVDIVTLLCNLGMLRCDRGDPVSAQKTLLAATVLAKETVGESDETFAHALNCLGVAKRLQGDPDAAAALFKRAHEIAIHGAAESLLTASIENNIADLQQSSGQLATARATYECVINRMSATLGQKHPLVAMAIHNLADCQRDQAMFDESRILDESACEILKETLGDRHPQYALCLSSLAETQLRLRETWAAKTLATRASGIFVATIGESHPWFASNLRVRSEVFAAHEQFNDADQCLSQAVSILERAAPRSDAMVRCLQSQLRLSESQSRKADVERLQIRIAEIQRKVSN